MSIRIALLTLRIHTAATSSTPDPAKLADLVDQYIAAQIRDTRRQLDRARGETPPGRYCSYTSPDDKP
jgi:hypothetical protein